MSADKPKSRYAEKLRRKHGNGTVDPRWMWWLENPAHPRRFAVAAQAAAKIAIIALLCFASSTASAAGGSRCHESTPSCSVGAEPICLCPSQQASDSSCHFVCGSLG